MANSVRELAGVLPGSPVEPSSTISSSVRDGAAESDQNGALAASDVTALSGLAGKIRSAISEAASISSFRPELVTQLKSAIANQSYKPEPGQVAERVAAAIGKYR
jgi:anti-sigma28 factor (negative regulator of flagellin synthesis)